MLMPWPRSILAAHSASCQPICSVLAELSLTTVVTAAGDAAAPQVCPCFHSGVVGPDGSPVLTWSQLHALYMLPDGTMWGEPSNFGVGEVLIKLGQQVRRPVLQLAEQDGSMTKGTIYQNV
jgi:hypothetical protein